MVRLNYSQLVYVVVYLVSISEADPSSGWSKPMKINANVQYASKLVHIVLSHWNAIYHRQLPNMLDISHDNAFLSFHPFEFEQRTLLARFRMNLTHPPHVQFVQKPVFAAIGMMGHLAEIASPVLVGSKGTVCLISRGLEKDAFYAAIVLTSSEVDRIEDLSDKLNHSVTAFRTRNWSDRTGSPLVWMAEYLEQDVTDPFHEWTKTGRWPFPDANLRQHMRRKEVSDKN